MSWMTDQLKDRGIGTSTQPAGLFDPAPAPAKPKGLTSLLRQMQADARQRADRTLTSLMGSTAINTDAALRAAQLAPRSQEVLGKPFPTKDFVTNDDARELLESAFMKHDVQQRLNKTSDKVAAWASRDPVNIALYDRYYGDVSMAEGVINSFLRPISVLTPDKGGKGLFVSGATQWELAQVEQEIAYREAMLAGGNAPLTEAERRVYARTGKAPEGKPQLQPSPFFGEDSILTRMLWGRQDGAELDADTNIMLQRGWTLDGLKMHRDMLRQTLVEAEQDIQFGVERANRLFPRAHYVNKASAEWAERSKGKEGVEAWRALADFTLENPGGLTAIAVDASAESLSSAAVGAAMTYLTRSPTTGLSAMSAINYGRMAVSARDEVAREMGYDLSKREDIIRLVNDPDARMLWSDRATAYAVTVAAIDTLSGGIAGKQLAKTPMGDVVVQALVQAVMGSGGEVLGRLAADLKMDPLEIVLEGLAEMITAPVEVMGVANRAYGKNRARREMGRATGRFLDALIAQSEKSEMRTAAPEKHAEFLAEVTKGTPVETLTIDTRKLGELFQSGEVTPEEFVAAFPSLTLEQVMASIEAGAGIEVTTAEYATNAVGRPFEGKLRGFLSIGDSFTTYEVDEQNSVKFIKQISDDVERVRQDVSRIESEFERVYDELRTDLSRNTGTTPEVARAQSFQIARAYSVFAKRAGMSLKDFVAKYPLPRFSVGVNAGIYNLRTDDLQKISTMTTSEGEIVREAMASAGLPPDATPQDIKEALVTYAGAPTTNDTELNQTVALRAGTEDLKAYGITTDKPSTREVAVALAARTRDKFADVGRGAYGQNAEEVIASMMAEELMYEIRDMPPKLSAAGWYTKKTQRALDIVGRTMFPELVDASEFRVSELPGVRALKNRPNARAMFTALLAITSDGAKVEDNLDHAIELYKVFRETNIIQDSARSTARAKSVKGNIQILQALYAEHGPNKMHKFLMREATVSEIKKELKAQGLGVGALQRMPASQVLPYAAVLLGPKLGSFYANLRGSTGYLTMDRWWTRTINRLRGDVLPRVPGLVGDETKKYKGEIVPKGLANFKALIGEPEITDEQAIDRLEDYQRAYADRDFKHDDSVPKDVQEIEKAANTLYKKVFVELQDQPDSSSDRGFQIRVAKRAQEILASQGEDITIADIQAIMWYYEKRLYTAMGVRPSPDISYEEAAKRVAAKDIVDKLDRPGRGLDQPLDAGATVIRSEQPVSAADLEGPFDERFFGRPGWAILTSDLDQPADSTVLPSIWEMQQQRKRDRLEEQLTAQGIPFRKVTGFYGGPPEHSLIIVTDEATALKIGKEYQQDSILTRDGFRYPDGRPGTLADGTILTGEAARRQGFYSRLDDGSMFALGLNWSTGPDALYLPPGFTEDPDKPGLPVNPEGRVELFHYSPQDDLDNVDPAFKGKGPMRNVDRFRGSYWGIALRATRGEQGGGYVRESKSLGDNLYMAEVRPQELYDYANDPDNLIAKDPTETEKKLIEAGFKGFYFGPGKTVLGQTAVLFETVPVEKVDEAAVLDRYRSPYGDRPGEELYQSGALNTDSAAFKAWFGDSKVVDKNGDPLVVYHGTDKTSQRHESFAFKTGQEGRRYVLFSESVVKSSGIFFSPSLDDAKSYGDNVGAYFLSAKRPLTDPRSYPVSSRSDPAVLADIARVYDDIEYIFAPVTRWEGDTEGAYPAEIDVDGGVSLALLEDKYDLAETVFGSGVDVTDSLIEWHWLDNPEVATRMRERGYDSARVAEPNDSSGMSWFVLDPAQAKATTNRGTFDPTDPRVLYQSDVRDDVVGGAGLKGDGRKFAGFFGDVTSGVRQQATNLDAYVPPIKLPPEVQEFAKQLASFSGNFDKHIMTSIPGYREMQAAVAYAISKTLGNGSVLRIGASEGSTVKAIVKGAGPNARGVAMDPNPAMQRTFDEKPQVPGVTFDLSAFGARDDAGQLLWTEDTGEEIRVFDPRGQLFDVVIEQMVFQFISNARNAQIAAAKQHMKPGGLFYTAEKVGGPADVYNANEAKKDLFKANFYSQEELAAKAKEVLQTGGDAVEGMTDLQVSQTELEMILKANFDHVVQVWDSGNFKGYAASDSVETLQGFTANLPALASEYATVRTPRRVGEQDDSQAVGSTAPLPGAPNVAGASGPDANLVAAAEDYARSVGIQLVRQSEFVQVDPEFAARIAAAYEAMPHEPENPAVQAAYQELIIQTRAQYDTLIRHGYVFTFFDDATDPYKGNPWDAMRDLRANKHMAVYGTYAGYGTEGITDSITDNPLLASTGLQWEDQNGVLRDVTANDLFRAVHDAFGHGIEGAGFRARGEENAWQAHRRLFYGLAVGALTTETRGQNSWLNYGPHGEKNRTASVEDTVFGEQKTGLMPAWTWGDRVVDAQDLELFQSDAFERWFGSSVVTDEQGDPLVVYHGSTSKDVEVFDTSLVTTRGAGDQAGTYFTPDPMTAGNYTRPPIGSKDRKARGKVYAAYLRIERPLDTTEDIKRLRKTGLSFGDAKREALKKLDRENHDGIVFRGDDFNPPEYVVFSSEQIKSTDNRGTFDPASGDIFEQRRRGSIILPPRGSGRAPVIRLMESSNLSTVLHESGHLFLYLMEGMVANGDAPQSVIDDYETLKGWWRDNAGQVAKEGGEALTEDMVLRYLATGTTGDAARDADVYRGMQEMFARGYETYLFEGKAPSSALTRLFQTFHDWLVGVYTDIRKLGVPINDEVRAVFDRMLAVDEEIAAAQATTRDPGLIAHTAEELGLSPEDWQKLVVMGDDAQEEAKRQLLAEIMAPVKAARRQEVREARDRITEEIRREVEAMPEYRIVEWLANNNWIPAKEGQEAPAANSDLMRLDVDLLIEDYGREILSQLPRGSRAIYTDTTAISADELAEWFGYRSGDEMIQALIAAPPKAKRIEQLVKERMRTELPPDPMTTGELPEMARNAIENDAKGRLIEAELRALGKVSPKRKRVAPLSEMRAAARSQIRNATVREATKSGTYRINSERAGEAAQRAFARGDIEQAFDEKRKQLMNHALFSEARKAEALEDKALKLTQRLRKPGTRKGVDAVYLAAIDEILDRYDFRKSMSRVQEQRRGALVAYVEMMEATGRANELAIPDHVLKQSQRKPYRTLSVRELEGVVDSLNNILHTGRFKKRLRDAQKQREFDEVRDSLLASATRFFTKKRKVSRAAPGKLEKWVNEGKALMDLVKNADTLLRRFDGWDYGEWVRQIKQPVDDAEKVAIKLRREAAERLQEIYSRYSQKEIQQMARRRHRPELSTPRAQAPEFSQWDMISIALNMGNADNVKRLMDKDTGYGFTRAQMEFVKQQLSDRDLDFVQDVWDHIDTFWPLIEERELRQTGVAPKKVEAVELDFGRRKLRGGYYPIKYDNRLSGLTEADEIAEHMKAMQAGQYGKAATRNGHTKERAGGSGGRVLQIGIEVYHQHLGQVIHDLAFSEAVQNAWRLLHDPQIEQFMRDYGTGQDLASLEMWLQDVATGQMVTGGPFARIAVKMKNTFTMSKLAFSMSTVLLQPTGLTQSMVVLGKVNFLRGLASYFRNRRRWNADVVAGSEFMRDRAQSFDRDINDLLRETQFSPVAGRYAQFQQAVARYGFAAMQFVQFHTADMPTWVGAYEMRLRETQDEAEARTFADRMVARAQASGLVADRSAIERGTLSRDTRMNGFVRLFTALGSYMFAKTNVAREVLGRAAQDVNGLNARSAYVIGNAAMDLTLLFTVEAALYHLIKGTLPGMGDDDDEDPSMTAFLARETLFSIMSGIPFVRDATSIAAGFSAGGAYGAISKDLTTFFTETAEMEFGRSFLRGTASAIGTVTGAPSSQGWRTLDALYQMGQGEDVGPLALIFGVKR